MEPTRELFEKVYIKTEKDLPEKDGDYDVCTKLGSHVERPFSRNESIFSPKWWMQFVRWYLQPVEQDPEADIPKHPTSFRDFSMNDEIEQSQSADFMQVRDLTDEEWLKLPKEEILQLYKNCYNQLMQLVKQGQIATTGYCVAEQPQSEIKTAEEFLKKKYHAKIISADAKVSKKTLIECMEEYASQFKIELPTEEPQRADPGNLFEWVKDWIKQKRGL